MVVFLTISILKLIRVYSTLKLNKIQFAQKEPHPFYPIPLIHYKFNSVTHFDEHGNTNQVLF